jgi:hypothetical protein
MVAHSRLVFVIGAIDALAGLFGCGGVVVLRRHDHG